MSSTRTVSPTLDRDRAAELAADQLEALLHELRALSEADWDRPTACPEWTVRDMVAHLAGADEEAVSPLVMLRHLVVGGLLRYRGRAFVDMLNQMQIDDRQGLGPEELIDQLVALGPRAIRARRRTPGLVRRLPLPTWASVPKGTTLGYLYDVTYTRDVWMHRIDIADATGRPLRDADSDTEVVALVVADLAHAWDGPTTSLTLTGRGGGTWQLGPGEPEGEAQADAYGMCRIWSGREADVSVTVTGDPSIEPHLLDARVLF